MNTIFWRVMRALLWILAALTALSLAFATALLQAFAPQPGEWSRSLYLGPLTRAVSVPALIRLATHPVGLTLLDGRQTDTAYGRWSWHRGPDDRLLGVCAPCTLQIDALGPRPLHLPQAALSLGRKNQSEFFGTLTLGSGERRVPLRWRARLSAEGLAIDADLADTPLADAYAVFGPEAIPELARARIGGRVGGRLQARWPQRHFVLQPRVEGFEVDGLGTEALLNAQPPQRCTAVDGAEVERVIGWLPRAVVAAEDQRFQEHAGYDLTQLLAAWSTNQQPGSAPQGASTLTQQLAKLVYVGDERSAVRKLRELLYAVEMERTLGKARILQLYLAMAPWGDGVCGADAAARHYLRKSSAKLTPLEAAWLASLLRDSSPSLPPPAGRRVDTQRVGWVLASLRGPLSPERRAEQLEALQHWAPPAARVRGGLRSPSAP